MNKAIEEQGGREISARQYAELLDAIKARIVVGRIRANLAANEQLVLMYWDIGSEILRRQAREGWGSKVIDRLAVDLRKAFPDSKGFSPRNLKYMRAFAGENPDRAIVQQLVAQIPWGHILCLMHGVKEGKAREWYVHQTIEHGWSRSMLALHVDAGDFERKGKAVTNFKRTLPAPQSDLAREVLKNPYVFDFFGIADEAREREVENALLRHLRDFLLELGSGFAFVGNQVRLEAGDEDYYIDLLFYHIRLRCFVVIDLKTKPFLPEDAGKMNFYLNAVDDLLRHPEDRPSIGLILCRKKGTNRVALEYALRGMMKPIGVSEYRLTKGLPKDLKPSLPSIEEIEREIAAGVDKPDDSPAGCLVREMRAKYGGSGKI